MTAPRTKGRIYLQSFLDAFITFSCFWAYLLIFILLHPGNSAHYFEFLDRYVRSNVKPGMTGLAQVRGYRGRIDSEADVVRRVESDIAYLETWSLSLDVVILVRTAWQVVRPPRTAG